MSNLSDDDRILIVGTGAMACFFAARLASAKVPVSMMGNWTEGLTTIGNSGVCLVNADGHEEFFDVRIFSKKGLILKAKHVLVLVKSWQTGAAAQRLADILSPDGVVVTLQNGLGNREVLLDLFGEARVAIGVTTSGATLLGPGRVRPGGVGKISLENHPRVGFFENVFKKAAFTVEIVENIESLIWGKLVVNSAINPLSALFRVPNGVLLSNLSCRELLGMIADESAVVANARGIKLPYEDPKGFVEHIAYLTATNYSSMFQDLARRAPTEIDAICGGIVKAAEEVGVAAPLNRACLLLIKGAVSLQEGI
jgi:2-dehydropantoate 2-reductase